MVAFRCVSLCRFQCSSSAWCMVQNFSTQSEPGRVGQKVCTIADLAVGKCLLNTCGFSVPRFSPHRPPAQPKSSTEPWLGSTAFNHKAYTSCSISLAALFASPLIVSQCVLVSTTCAHKAEAGEHLEEEGSMAAAFARPVGEGKLSLLHLSLSPSVCW